MEGFYFSHTKGSSTDICIRRIFAPNLLGPKWCKQLSVFHCTILLLLPGECYSGDSSSSSSSHREPTTYSLCLFCVACLCVPPPPFLLVPLSEGGGDCSSPLSRSLSPFLGKMKRGRIAKVGPREGSRKMNNFPSARKCRRLTTTLYYTYLPTRTY